MKQGYNKLPFQYFHTYQIDWMKNATCPTAKISMHHINIRGGPKMRLLTVRKTENFLTTSSNISLQTGCKLRLVKHHKSCKGETKLHTSWSIAGGSSGSTMCAGRSKLSASHSRCRAVSCSIDSPRAGWCLARPKVFDIQCQHQKEYILQKLICHRLWLAESLEKIWSQWSVIWGSAA